MLGARTAKAFKTGDPLDGEAEADEGHFGARYARGRGARGKTIVFGPLRRGGRVCT